MSDHSALLQTDIVDSTRISAELGDAAMAAVWAAHDQIARSLLRQWRGREIDKSDGFLLLFVTAADALGYALAYHHALGASSPALQARIGLHVGPVTTRQNSSADVALGAKTTEIEGLAKPLTSRVMSLAQGGQTLLTVEARAALGATALRLQGHGWWRVKGLEEPIELFEAGEAGAPFSPPPDSSKAYRVVRHNDLWLPLREVRHSLPAERDSFVGQRAPLQDLVQRFEAGARLVSVLGTGGIGKTRLAQRFGWNWLGDFPGGVWFCDLSQARTLDGVVHAVAQGLEMPLGGDDPVSQIGRALAGRGRCLVVLDTFEQVSRHAEATVGQWLDRAVHACFIVTSREVLGIPGEEVLAVAPLPYAEAATLFMRRAAAVRRDFHPTVQDQDAIAPLVKLLDGLPLAIELAAARVRVMPPRVLLERMSQRFRLLTSSGGRSDRQATLRATLDWSWELLSAAEKAALAQLAVFQGGFSLPAAEAVLDLADCGDERWPLDVVQSLVEKSLLRSLDDQRFDLLNSVQDYAAGHLGSEGRFPGSGPDAEGAARARHWRWYAALDEAGAVAGGCIEIDNLVVACRRAAAHGDAANAARVLVGAWAALELCGPFSAGVELADKVRAVPGLRSGDRALVDWVAGSALYMLGRTARARERFEVGLAAAREAGDRQAEARLLCATGTQCTAEGETEHALEALQRALALIPESGGGLLRCHVYNRLGALCQMTGRFDAAQAHYEAALTLARELGDRHWEGGLLGNLGGLHFGRGRRDEARSLYEQALSISRQTGDRRWEGNTRCNLGLIEHELGHDGEAQAQLEAALQTARDMGHARLEVVARDNLGILLESHGELEAAQTHYTKAVEVAREVGDRRSEGQVRIDLGRLLARLGRHGEARDCLDVGATLLLAASDRISLGLLRCAQAESEHRAGNAPAGAAALAQAEALLQELNASAESELGRALAKARELGALSHQ